VESTAVPATIDVFAEWTTHALWTDGEVDDDGRKALGISVELFTDFRTWNEEWERLADYDELNDEAWNASPEVNAWNEHGYELAARLRAEVGDRVAIRYFDYVTEAWVNV
jgi:hypothetical protein